MPSHSAVSVPNALSTSAAAPASSGLTAAGGESQGRPSRRVIGRALELERLLEAVREGEPAVLWGPPGMGATTVADAVVAARQATEPRTIVLRGDASLAPTPAHLVASLIRQFGVGLDPHADAGLSALPALFPGLQLATSWDADAHRGEVRLPPFTNAEGEAQRLLTAFLTALPVVATTRKRPVLLVLEGAPDLARWLDEDLETWSRRHLGALRRRVPLLLQASHAAAFAWVPLRLYLGELPWEEHAALLRDTLARQGLALEDDAAGTLFDLADDSPRAVQQLLDVAAETARRQGRTTIGSRAVREAAQTWTQRLRAVYAAQWRQCTMAQQLALQVVIQGRGEGWLRRQGLQGLGLTPTGAQRALGGLLLGPAGTGRDILWLDERERKPRLRFTDPLFAAWIRREVLQDVP